MEADMCAGDDFNCPDFERHRANMREALGMERRSFLKSAFVATGGAAAIASGASTLVTPALAQASAAKAPAQPSYHHLPANDQTVHWGYFSKSLKPQVEISSGDYVTIEALTHHANDDAELMVKGDEGAESVFYWTKEQKKVARRGAGDVNDKKLGGGGGLGVHICTGPVHVRGAQPGDVLEVRIIDTKFRPSQHPDHKGKTFGSNAAANWGFHYKDLITGEKPREVVTIYEVDASGARNWARAVYNFKWAPQTDPDGIVHPTIDYPGVPVDHSTIKKNTDVLKGVRVPIRPHFGVIAVAPKEAEYVNSIPPGYFGGNIDNWRIGKGATMYYPVAVEGALMSVGDPHASQGDSELCGTAIECSLTGTFQIILHKKADIAGTPLEQLEYPMLETQDDWLIHGFSYANYLADLGPNAQNDIFSKSSVDLALKDAFRKMRTFLMTTKGLTEDEAISLMSLAVDFGITQVVDGNWGVHAVIKKNIFAEATA
jgi:acetamidase/formamidase